VALGADMPPGIRLTPAGPEGGQVSVVSASEAVEFFVSGRPRLVRCFPEISRTHPDYCASRVTLNSQSAPVSSMR
jgi:hypothetical protein